MTQIGARYRGINAEASTPSQHASDKHQHTKTEGQSSPSRRARKDRPHRYLREQAVPAADSSPVHHWNRPPPSRKLAIARRERSRPRTATVLNPAGFATGRSTGPSDRQSRRPSADRSSEDRSQTRPHHPTQRQATASTHTRARSESPRGCTRSSGGASSGQWFFLSSLFLRSSPPLESSSSTGLSFVTVRTHGSVQTLGPSGWLTNAWPRGSHAFGPLVARLAACSPSLHLACLPH